MGKIEDFRVSFAESKTIYYPGNTVSGQLLVRLKSPMDMKAIKLTFVGKAYVHWTEQRTVSNGKTTYTVTDHYYGKESLFEQTIVVHGEGHGVVDGNGSLSQGEHFFPFNFQLPSPLPSSYEDKIGHIRYYVKGTIVKPWKFDHSTKAAFTVLDMLDLNDVPNATSPSIATESKYLCCWCCKNGPITVDFQTERTGYVPGEWINIEATLKNSSSSKVKATSLHLSKRMTYRATTKTKHVTKHLVTVPGPKCKKNSTVSIKNSLQIPPLPPSESQHCRIIDIEYMVTFEGHLRTCAVNLREGAPIVIGTVPLRSLEIYRNAPQQPVAVPTPVIMGPTALNAPESRPQTNQPTAYSTMPPPPSYAAATDGGVNIRDEDDNEHTMGDTTFTPQYTFYDWSQPAFTYN